MPVIYNKYITGKIKEEQKVTFIYKKVILILFPILIIGCQNGKIDDGTFNVVKIDIDDVGKETINNWFDSIELIPLAATNNSFIKEACKLLKYNNSYYILDNWQHTVFIFDSIGNYVNSTQHLNGAGPNEYTSLVDFDIDKINGNLHILDPVSKKIRIYDRSLSPVADYNINDHVLPLQYFKYIKDSLYVFYCPSRKKGEFAIKFYDAKDETILKKELPTTVEEAAYLPNTLYSPFYEFNNNIFFTQKYPNNEIFQIDTKEKMLKKYLKYDFNEQMFNVEELKDLNSCNLDDYTNYIEYNNNDKCFVFTKNENSIYQFISVYYKHCIFIIKHNKITKHDKVIVNDYSKRGSLGRAIFLDEDYYYCAANPEHLKILTDDKLLTKESCIILSQAKEDDNPLIVKYKLK